MLIVYKWPLSKSKSSLQISLSNDESCIQINDCFTGLFLSDPYKSSNKTIIDKVILIVFVGGITMMLSVIAENKLKFHELSINENTLVIIDSRFVV